MVLMSMGSYDNSNFFTCSSCYVVDYLGYFAYVAH